MTESGVGAVAVAGGNPGQPLGSGGARGYGAIKSLPGSTPGPARSSRFDR